MGNLETGFSGRSIPFFSLPASKVFEFEPTVSEALDLAGLNFEVKKRPVFDQKANGDFVEVPGKFVTYRTDTEFALGVVGNQYQPFNNEPALGLVDELLGHGARIAAAGSWNNGADVFITAALQNGITVPGEEDLDLFLLFRNNHSGTGAVSAYVTPMRISCTNMLRSAIGQSVSSWKIRHTRTVADRVQEASVALRLVDSYKEEMEGAIRQLQETEISADEFENFIKELTEDKAERVQKSMIDTYNDSDTVTRGNCWGAFNAVTEALDWASPRQTGIESRFASQVEGPISRTRDRAMRLLLTRR